jgi:ABC-type antimicrobial peptide transport system permease subunit
VDEVSGDAPLVSAVVNEAFAKRYFGTQYPIGKQFRNECTKGMVQVVGVVKNARYLDVREGAHPAFYMPFHAMNKTGALVKAGGGTLVVRTAVSDAGGMAEALRKKVKAVNAEMQVENVHTQQELIDAQTVRERALALLATFLAVTAPLLAGIGLYGVLSYSVLLREREFGIRLAMGAPTRTIAWLVTSQIFVVVTAGAAAGAVVAGTSARYVHALLFGVSGGDPRMYVGPSVLLLVAAGAAALAPVLRAVGIDPAVMLRGE